MSFESFLFDVLGPILLGAQFLVIVVCVLAHRATKTKG